MRVVLLLISIAFLLVNACMGVAHAVLDSNATTHVGPAAVLPVIYSVQPIARWFLDASSYVNVYLEPIGATALAGYLLMLERQYRVRRDRGFDVDPLRPADGT